MHKIISSTLAFGCLFLFAANNSCSAENKSTPESKPVQSSATSATTNTKKETTAPVKKAPPATATANKKAPPSAKKQTTQAKVTQALKSSGAHTVAPAAKGKPAIKAQIAPATVTKDGKPIWLDLKSARLAAKLKNKPIFADFYTDWCGWCKYMDKTTFHDQKVEDYLSKNFVCTRLNAQDGADGEELAHRYSVMGYPTFMVFESQGKKIGQMFGYQEPDPFLASLKKTLPHPETKSVKHP